jgi:hypothetical protein
MLRTNLTGLRKAFTRRRVGTGVLVLGGCFEVEVEAAMEELPNETESAEEEYNSSRLVLERRGRVPLALRCCVRAVPGLLCAVVVVDGVANRSTSPSRLMLRLLLRPNTLSNEGRRDAETESADRAESAPLRCVLPLLLLLLLMVFFLLLL